MSKAERRALKGPGPMGKPPNKHVATKVVKLTDKDTLQGFVKDRAAKDATVYTDDTGAYDTVPFDCPSAKRSPPEYVKGDVHANGIESPSSMLKRA